jgi:2,3,4,5-tetrahydropyridine-2-carboxylate N-succinyltransferase
VIVEDEAFVGAQAALLEGVLVKKGAVIAAGVILTGTSRLYDLVQERSSPARWTEPLVVPAGGRGRTRRPPGEPVSSPPLTDLALSAAIVVKYRDDRTDARVALEEALR